MCISWNYESVFNIIMHGANMKMYKYNFNISAFVGFIYKIVCYSTDMNSIQTVVYNISLSECVTSAILFFDISRSKK
jgi:hypothetical protein